MTTDDRKREARFPRTKTKTESISRRDFLGQTGSAMIGAAALGAAGCVRRGPGSAPIAPPRVLGANDTINLGVIGVGGRGGHLLSNLIERQSNPNQKIKVTAVCEIYDRRKKEAVNAAGLSDCYHDYRDLLADPNVDGVVIATPDHWHARMSIDAMQAGKDVYCEKPMTLYWDEAKDVTRVWGETGRVFQVGAGSASEDQWWQARDLIGDGKSGLIGKLIQFQTSYNRNVPGGDWNYTIHDDCTPKTLDWKRFLGPAPDRPFDAERYFRFRKYWDYSGGLATDLLYHRLAHMEVALGFPFALRVAATGGNYIHFDREVPDTFTILADFEDKCTGMLISTAGNDDDIEEMIRGEHGTMTFRDDSVMVAPQSEWMDTVAEKVKTYDGLEIEEGREDGKTVIKEIRRKVAPRLGHMDKFLACMRSRERTHLNADDGYRVMTAIALGVRAYRESRTLKFDPETELVSE